jgi:hypothetical protein
VVIDQLRTIARQCYAWTLPYGLAFVVPDLKDGAILSESVNERVEMLVQELQVYGLLLRQQRRADLRGKLPSFLARCRAPGRMNMS